MRWRGCWNIAFATGPCLFLVLKRKEQKFVYIDKARKFHLKFTVADPMEAHGSPNSTILQSDN